MDKGNRKALIDICLFLSIFRFLSFLSINTQIYLHIIFDLCLRKIFSWICLWWYINWSFAPNAWRHFVWNSENTFRIFELVDNQSAVFWGWNVEFIWKTSYIHLVSISLWWEKWIKNLIEWNWLNEKRKLIKCKRKCIKLIVMQSIENQAIYIFLFFYSQMFVQKYWV